METDNCRTLMLDRLGDETVALLGTIGEFASRSGLESYLIGGVVRDMFLEQTIKAPDIDIMLEGDAKGFARSLRAEWPSLFPTLLPPRKLDVFKRYGTAKLTFEEPICDGISQIDFAMARSETYESSGAAPVVAPGSLQADLKRRDFSINAMALSLSPARFGEIHDPLGGRRDIEAGQVRILHEESFSDDPARLIRAVRFLVRLGFSFESQTEKLFETAAQGDYLARLPLRRLKDEFQKAKDERGADEILEELDRRALLKPIELLLESEA